ncbi:unnamed protein product [Clonostachys byssicola]|uniref:Uncharacterized protein n=1 Tax=Clonostachys byssicola TaxID=160290 RepID=A0A9N9U912_9HYPO|nr:unnamed protein product [Clonostachys byssicola]
MARLNRVRKVRLEVQPRSKDPFNRVKAEAEFAYLVLETQQAIGDVQSSLHVDLLDWDRSGSAKWPPTLYLGTQR